VNLQLGDFAPIEYPQEFAGDYEQKGGSIPQSNRSFLFAA
jgi:hypothetical protein